MFSKSIEKYVNSLKEKKHRIQERRFIAEGEKIADEILRSDLNVAKIIATPEWLHNHMAKWNKKKTTVIEVTATEMKRISGLVQPSGVLLIVEIPEATIDEEIAAHNINLVLEDIRDPGNLGTIVRIADWFGITYIFCSDESVDVYNPKAVQASMGSICRVKVLEVSIKELFQQFPSIPVYATALEGESIHSASLAEAAFIVIGNEARGVSEQLMPYISTVLTIPKSGGAESLNAAVAAGIVCAMFRKPHLQA